MLGMRSLGLLPSAAASQRHAAEGKGQTQQPSIQQSAMASILLLADRSHSCESSGTLLWGEKGQHTAYEPSEPSTRAAALEHELYYPSTKMPVAGWMQPCL
jgi:hypothetical protein